MTDFKVKDAPVQLSSAGIELMESIGQGASSIVFRARMHGQDVAVKVYRDQASEQSVRKFRKEAASLARMVAPGLPRIMRYGVVGQQPFMVMELLSGGSLSDAMRAKPGAWPEADVIAMALQLLSALSTIHRAGLIHRDLKPDNVLLNSKGEARIIDFDLATHTHASSGREVVGTPGYSAPELTGLVNRKADKRADLYSIGVILYEMLCGERLFSAGQPSELLRMHAFEIPPRLDSRVTTIRPIVAAIVHKLLEKNPDDRYGSADSLLRDLEELESLHRQWTDGKNPPLGLGEGLSALIDQLPLFGRSRETAMLQQCVADAIQGKAQNVLVEGVSGVGKSKLVIATLQQASHRGMLRLMAKCVEGDLSPLAPLRATFDSLAWAMRSGSSGANISVDSITKALKPFEWVIQTLSPRLASTLGFSTKGTGALGEQFLETVAEAILALEKVSKGIVLFLDDIQWCDAGTLQVLGVLSERASKNRILFLATARSGPVYLEKVKRFADCLQPGEVKRIELEPLNDLDVQLMMQSLLGGMPIAPQLAQKVTLRAKGNPFAVGEFVRALSEAGLLIYESDRWVLDETGFDQLQLPDDVLQLVVRRLESVTGQTKQLLLAAAVHGNAFIPSQVEDVVRNSGNTASFNLLEPLQLGLIEATEDGHFRFVHDRIREALLGQAELETIKNLHQAWAVFLETQNDSSRENVFSIARHRKRGQIQNDPRKALKAILEAASLAFETFASDAATEFLDWANNLSAEYGESLSYEYYVLRGENAIRTGRPSSEAISWLKEAAHKAQNNEDKAFALARKAYVLTIRQEFDEAMKQVDVAMRLIGFQAIGRSFGAVVSGLASPQLWFGKSRNVPTAEQKRRLLGMELSYVQAYIGFFTMDTALMLNAALRERQLTERLPECAAKIRAVTDTAFIFTNAGQHNGLKWAHEALQRAEQFGDPWVIARSAAYAVWARLWLGIPDDEAREAIVTKYDSWLSLEEWINARLLLGWEKLLQGYSQAALNYLQECNRRWTQRYSEGDTLNHMPWSLLFVAQHLSGHKLASQDTRDAAQRIAAKSGPDERFMRLRLLGCEAMVDCFEENVANLDAYEQRHRDLKANPQFVDFSNTSFYVASARLWSLAFFNGKGADSEKKARTALARLQTVAKGNKTLLAHYEIASAYFFSRKGKKKAMTLALQNAEAWSRTHNLPLIQFDLAVFHARHFLAEGNRSLAMTQVKFAHDLTQIFQWPGLAKRLEREFSYVSAQPSKAQEVGNAPVAMSMYASAGAQAKLDALLEVSLALSTVFDLNRQLEIALDEMLRIFGAERAFIFLNQEDGALNFRLGRGPGKTTLEASGHSGSIVSKVALTRQAQIASATQSGELLQTESVLALGLRSLIASPLQAKERLWGVVYLDSTVERGNFSPDDLDLLMALSNHIAVALESARAAQSEVQKAALEKDLAVTGAVQSLLLPVSSAWRHAGIQISASFSPASQSGGDWWWLDETMPDKIRIIVGDVTGHGAGSAMVTAAVAGAYQTLESTARGRPIEDVLGMLNEVVTKICRGQYSMTLCALELSRQSNQFQLCFAGAPPVLLMRKDGRCEPIVVPSVALGSNDWTLGSTSGELLTGDVLFLATDGVYERTTKSGRPFGIARAKKILEKSRDCASDQIRAEVASQLTAMALGDADDDTTFAIIKKSEAET